MIRIVTIFIVCFVFARPALASSDILTVDLAETSVDISTGFDGASLSLFGVKNKDGHVVVVIKGPTEDFIVRKKKPGLGVWMNRQSLLYKDVPQFYDFALSDDEENILTADMRKELGIGFDALKFTADENNLKPNDLKAFQQALLRNKQADGLFPVVAKRIVFLSDTFFKTEFYVPSNVPTGQYVIETFLIYDGRVLEKSETNLKVAQVGFSSGVYQFANSHALLYALFIVFIAVVAGWLSNAVRKNNN